MPGGLEHRASMRFVLRGDQLESDGIAAGWCAGGRCARRHFQAPSACLVLFVTGIPISWLQDKQQVEIPDGLQLVIPGGDMPAPGIAPRYVGCQALRGGCRQFTAQVPGMTNVLRRAYHYLS
mgnify:CR=1 FL=1